MTSNKRSLKPTYLTVDDLRQAELDIIHHCQQRKFQEDISTLQRKETVKKSSRFYRLNPQLQEGILRVGGRLSRASMPAEAKHPMPACLKIITWRISFSRTHMSGLDTVDACFVSCTSKILDYRHSLKTPENSVSLHYLSETTWCIRHTNYGGLTKKQSGTRQTTFYQKWSGSVWTIRYKTWKIICKKVQGYIYLPCKSCGPHRNGNIAENRLLYSHSASLHRKERSIEGNAIR